MSRPSVDVVVPFVGSDEALARLVERLAALRLGAADSLTVVDNAPSAAARSRHGVRVVAAPQRQSSYFARNRGAAAGRADWLLFIDADVDPRPDLVDRYFDTAPRPGTAVLAGGVVDRRPDGDRRQGVAERFAFLQSTLDQDNTVRGDHPYAQTANCAVRRDAFEAVGGFRDDIRSGGDADLCFRLAAAGHGLERRQGASVTHLSRETVPALLRQKARHGSGAAWLERSYPGFAPRKDRSALAKWTLRSTVSGLRAVARRDRDAAIRSLLLPVTAWAFELGRRFSNRVVEA